MFLQGLLGLPERKGKGMKHQIGCVCVLLLLLVAARLACQSDAQIQAQDKAKIEAAIRAQDPSQQPAEPTLKRDPIEAMRNFEPAADEEYQLGKGDEITVDFAGRTDLPADPRCWPN